MWCGCRMTVVSPGLTAGRHRSTGYGIIASRETTPAFDYREYLDLSLRKRVAFDALSNRRRLVARRSLERLNRPW